MQGMSWNQNGSRRQIGVGPLICNQEQRALLVLLINFGTTAIFSSNGLHRISLVRASGELFRTVIFDALESTRDACLLRKQSCRASLPSRPAMRRPTRLARGVSGF